jgi:hypothetical protein
VNLVDQGVELVLRLVLIVPADEAEVDCGVTAVGDDREQDVVALLRLPLPRLDRLDALGEMALIGEEGLARRGRDDLTSAARDRGQAEILPQVGLEHHVCRHASDRHEVGDVDGTRRTG